MDFYHPRMRVAINFSHVSPSISLSVCLSVCVSIQALNVKLLKLGTSFYIFAISRSSLSIKVKLNMTEIPLKLLKGQDHLKVKVS